MPEPGGPDGAAVLRHLVGDDVEFRHHTFGRRPHLHRGDGTSRELPLDLDGVDELLTQRSLRAPAFRLVRDGAPLSPSTYTRTGRIGGVAVTDLPDPGRVFEHLHRGATLVLQGLHRYWPPVSEICRGLEAVLTHPVQANAYLTPPVNRGLDVHHDTHDVLALQLVGRKHWVVHEPAVPAALPSQPWSPEEHEPGPAVLDTELTAGDVLYLPRGTPHAAETTSGVSLHLTLGIRTVTWVDALRRAFDHLGEQVRFRESLPAGFAAHPEALRDELAGRLREAAQELGRVDPGTLADEVASGFRSRRLPALSGQLHQVLALGQITDETVVRRRPGVEVVRTPAVDGRVELVLVDRTVSFPAGVAALLDRLLSGEALAVAALTPLDTEGRTVLARRLVREGVLVASSGGDRDGA